MAKYTDWLTKEGLIKIEGWARDGLTDEQVAKNIGISRSTLNGWKKRFSEVKDALKKGKEVADRQVENALYKRAIGYEYVEITKERIITNGKKKYCGRATGITEEEWEMALAYFGQQCVYCGACSKLSKDHLDLLKSLENGDALTISTVIPACRSCHSSKKDQQWLLWYQKQECYDQKKVDKITEYIDFVSHLPKKQESTGELVVTKEVVKQVAPNPTSAIFWLKNRKPEVWRDKHETEHSGSINMADAAKEIERFFDGSDSS